MLQVSGRVGCDGISQGLPNLFPGTLWRFKREGVGLKQFLGPCRFKVIPLCSSGSKGFGTKPKATSKKKADQQDIGYHPWQEDKSLCPCCSGRKYEGCCQPLHKLERVPQTPEELMRSRFAAYALGGNLAVSYISGTTLAGSPASKGSLRPDGTLASSLAEDVAATCRTTAFLRLKVMQVEPSSSLDEGFVAFKFWFRVLNQRGQRQQGNAVGCMSERSRFIRHEGTWFYVDGKSQVVTSDGILA
eukprot:jgi/Botrbrau1/319/Bobra.0022s0281.2